MISPIFSFQCTDFWGGSMTGFLRERHFVVVFFLRFDEKTLNRKLDIVKAETDFQAIDTFSYENLADDEL